MLADIIFPARSSKGSPCQRNKEAKTRLKYVIAMMCTKTTENK